QRQLGIQLRALYEQEQPSFVSVLLSAGSLDGAVQVFDDLTRAAGATGSVIQQAQAAGTDVTRLVRSLQARADRLSRLERPADAGPGSALRTLVVSSTGYSLPGTTAIGLPVAKGIVAVDPTVIPLGTRLTIPGYGEGIAADTGSAVKGYNIDLWFPTFAQAS